MPTHGARRVPMTPLSHRLARSEPLQTDQLAATSGAAASVINNIFYASCTRCNRNYCEIDVTYTEYLILTLTYILYKFDPIKFDRVPLLS